MNFQREVVVFLTKIIQAIIVERFANIFFDTDENNMRRRMAYSFFVLITTYIYLFSNVPGINLICTFCGLLLVGGSYNGTVKRKCIFAFYIMAISCLIDVVVDAMLVRELDFDKYSTYVSILALLLLLTAQLITKRLFEKNKNSELTKRHWMFYIASLFVSIVTSIFLFEDRTISTLSLSVICGAFLVVNLIISYLIDDLVESSEDVLENQMLRDQMRAYEREIALQNEKMETLRSFKHDIKHHLFEISALASSGRTELIERYVSNMNYNLNESIMLVDSGNVGLDSVLNYMLQRAEDKNIHINIKITVPENLELSAYDMNIIFGNIIENALEAQKDVKHPKIDLIIRYSVGSLIIELSNTYTHKVKFKGGIPVTTKQSLAGHGYGIRNVKKVLDKYTSTLEFESSEDVFIVKILIKIE